TALVQHRYSVNVRELDALLLRASIESRGKYVDLTGGLRHSVAASTPPPTPASADAAEGFSSSAEERRRLALLRKHRFSASACASDPAYGVNRATADLHLRQLMVRALAMSGWNIDAAAAMMAGDDEALSGKLRRRIETFLLNLQRRIEEHG